MRKLTEVMEVFYIFIWVVVMLVYTYVKTHNAVHLRLMHYAAYKIYRHFKYITHEWIDGALSRSQKRL